MGLGRPLVWVHRAGPRGALPRWNACQQHIYRTLNTLRSGSIGARRRRCVANRGYPACALGPSRGGPHGCGENGGIWHSRERSATATPSGVDPHPRRSQPLRKGLFGRSRGPFRLSPAPCQGLAHETGHYGKYWRNGAETRGTREGLRWQEDRAQAFAALLRCTDRVDEVPWGLMLSVRPSCLPIGGLRHNHNCEAHPKR